MGMVFGAILSWLGRQGTRAIAAVVIIGIAVPPLGALLKPFVGAAIFALLTTAFLRIDPAALRQYVTKPALLGAASTWTALVIPSLFGMAAGFAGLYHRSPDLFLAVMLQGIASPMMATPAIAALMGLDATLVLLTLTISSALTPFTAPLIATVFIGRALPIPPLALGMRLLAILGGSALTAFVFRRVIGLARIGRWKSQIDGLNVLLFFVFVAAAMQDVGARFIAAPIAMIELTLLAFGVFLTVLGLTVLVFAWAGLDRAMALGLMTSQRNLGLILAAAGSLPELAWLYFGLCQLPIYLSPQLLKPLLRRLPARSASGDQAAPIAQCDGTAQEL
jgi:BASS family bile acid:Na+ symporter